MEVPFAHTSLQEYWDMMLARLDDLMVERHNIRVELVLTPH